MVMGLCFGFTGMAMAADTADQTATYEVIAINEIAVAGDVSLQVNTAIAGSQPTQANDTDSTYSITTNCGTDAKKITAALNTAMPTGLTLTINMPAPTDKGTTAGDVVLTNVAANVVTAISAVAQANILVAYYLDATVEAGVVASATKTVTFTITDT
jgi:hypothetical protein